MKEFPLDKLTDKFREHADPEKAFHMKKYMKNRYEFFGIQANPRRKISKIFLQEYGLPPKNKLFKIIQLLWNQDQREYQHFGAELADMYKNDIQTDDLEIFKWMIVHKSWWDTVDFVAIQLVGNYFLKYKEQTRPVMKEWLDSGNIWLQRTTLIFQLKYKKSTDLDLLSRHIHALKESKEFFIRKAIGWVLREYSKTDQYWVKDFVSDTPLSPLSTREALKRVEIK